ncbi:MAG: helix-turn-helix domain-containing protein [Moraxellaceae bacterium]
MPDVFNRKVWKGEVLIRPGVGIFQGVAGDNAEHRHWAHQLSIGQGNDVDVTSKGRLHRAAAVFIPANTPHQLVPGPVLSIYLDPTSVIAKVLCRRFASDAPLIMLSDTDIEWLLPEREKPVSLDFVFDRLSELGAISDPLSADPRWRTVITAIEKGIRDHEEVGRDMLASLLSLSGSRFSHWFREQTGMPLRSYRKWLRLIYGMERALQGDSLTVAAHEARFADQAHFSRTFSDAFGVSPSDALAYLSPPTTHQS